MEPIDAVIFDFHSTLVDNGNPHEWLIRALRKLAKKNGQTYQNDDDLLRRFEETTLSPVREYQIKQSRTLCHPDIDSFTTDLHKIWEHSKKIDPKSSRDLSPELHRSVFFETMKTHFETPHELSEALYDTLTEGWIAYDDAIPVLKTLKGKGLKLGLISNVGFDVRPVLEREEMRDYFDSIVLSCDVDEVKPSKSIFMECLNQLQVDPMRCFMVGDDVHADGGAALLGIRTLIIPKTIGRVHGLELVSKIIC